MNKEVASKKAPAAIGPYSQAIQAGNTIYVSGQLPIDAKTGTFPADDIAAQTRQSLENIKGDPGRSWIYHGRRGEKHRAAEGHR